MIEDKGKKVVPDIMKVRNWYFQLNSISIKLITGVVIILGPLIGLLIVSNFYAVNVIHNQVAETHKDMLALYLGEIDKSLDDVDNYFVRLSALNNNFEIIQHTQDENEYNLVKWRLWKRMSEDITMYKTADSFFIYTPSKQELLEIFNSGEGFDERERVKKYMNDMLSANPTAGEINAGGWLVKKIHEDYYLIRVIKSNHTYIGAWVNVKKILIPLELIDLGEEGASLLVTDHGELMTSSKSIQDKKVDLSRDFQHYYLTGDYNKYLLVGNKSTKGNFSLAVLIPNDKILGKMPYLQWIIIYIALGSIFLVPLSYLLLRNIVLIPLGSIITAMKEVREANLDVRISACPTSNEFQLVNQTFNQMVAEIHDLKISVYEEKLNKQKIEAERLQMQINPHFFMNSLNIIHSLALTKNYSLILEMVQCLGNYFRYMLKSNMAFVRLRDELQHIQNYLRIQELRFPESLNFEIEASEPLLDAFIPTLAIQTFVENSVKYGAVSVDSLYISIEVDRADIGEKPFMRAIVKDTGKGFTNEILSNLNNGQQIIDERGEHIGIWNLQRRLGLLYSGEADINFANSDSGGAVVEILLPLKLRRGEK